MGSKEYHEDYSYWGVSMLKVAEEQPWLARDVFCERVRELGDEISQKEEVIVGSVVHEVLLEGRELEDACRVIPLNCLKSNGHINPKPFGELREAYPEVVWVKEGLFKRIFEVIESVRGHELWGLLSRPGMEFEQPYRWVDAETGIPCKCRPDFMYRGEDFTAVYDLKVSAVVDPDRWGRVAKSLKYWLQDAHYSSGMAQLFERPVTFVFWVVESVEPYRIASYRYDSISRERAFEAYRGVLGRLQWRLESGDWSDSWERGTNDLVLNPWEVGASADGELEGFGEDEEEGDGEVEA